jgi:hypothetical protein
MPVLDITETYQGPSPPVHDKRVMAIVFEYGKGFTIDLLTALRNANTGNKIKT